MGWLKSDTRVRYGAKSMSDKRNNEWIGFHQIKYRHNQESERQNTEWKKTLANHVSYKGLVSRIYIKNSFNSIIKRQHIQ